MYAGKPGDVDNTISAYDAYQMFDMPTDIGRPDAGSDTAPTNDVSNNTRAATIDASGPIGKPSHWWLMFALVFFGFIWLARRYGGGDKYSNIRMSVYNGIFMTFWIVLILNFLKVVAARFPNNPVSTLILAA